MGSTHESGNERRREQKVKGAKEKEGWLAFSIYTPFMCIPCGPPSHVTRDPGKISRSNQKPVNRLDGEHIPPCGRACLPGVSMPAAALLAHSSAESPGSPPVLSHEPGSTQLAVQYRGGCASGCGGDRPQGCAAVKD